MRKFLAVITIAAASLTACQPTASTVTATTAAPNVNIGDYGHGQPLDAEINSCEDKGGAMVDSTYPAPAPAGPITWVCIVAP